MASQPNKLHIFFFPLMAPGHIIPMLNLAKMFTLRGVGATVLATPTSTPFLRDTVDRARDSGCSINLLVIPSSSSSSPSGAENLTSPEMSPEFFTALESFRQPLDRVLREHRPSCIVSDMFMPFTEEVANDLNIPRLVFHSMGFFPLCVIDSVDRSISNGSITIDDVKDTIVVPGLPHRIEMKRSQLHNPTGARNKFSEFMERVNESELKSYGAVVNSFYELEPEYADHYRSTMGRKARCVGPVSLIDSEASTVEAQRHSVIAWLDSKPPRSVVYVSFGSLSRLTEQQLREIACGLESSGHFYVWVVRSRHDSECRHDNEKGKGMIVEGWAPQQAILRHAAVGGFVTHCGWNSVMESAEAGVPMVTWPMFAEQFYNERLVVEVAGIGVGLGAEEWGNREEEKSRRGVVGREEIRRAVCCVMDGGDAEGERVRRRAEKLRVKARRAMEAAGSSYSELDRLIDELSGFCDRPIAEGTDLN